MTDSQSSPSSEGDSKSLAHQINTAIASSHTKINRLILDHMPKAVPPQTDTPSAYITGLLHIGAMYIAFESLWQNLLGLHSEIAPIPYTFPFTKDPDQRDETPQITGRLRRVLEEAYWPTLLRAARIKTDVQAMTGWPDHVFDEELRSAGTSGRLGKFTLHIQTSINAKPHLLLAYAYCLYLALLSGGSYIRTELMYLPADFWRSLPTPIKPNMVACRQDKVKQRRRHSSLQDDDNDDVDEDTRPSGLANHRDSSIELPLAFLDFDPPLGENPRQQAKGLKAEFKQRFAEADRLLADPERRDIIKESAVIFHHLEGVVVQLDKMFGTADPVIPPVKTLVQRALDPTPSRTGEGIGFRLRDSIAIAKGRLLRMRRKSSGSSVTATVPTIADKLSVTDSQGSESSKAGSVTDPDENEEGEDAVYVKNTQSDVHEKQIAPESILARNAVVPTDGFRTIRYDSKLPKPEKSTLPLRTHNHNEKNSSRDVESLPGFDGSGSDIQYCPMSSSPTTVMAAVQTKAEPNYALYVLISNTIVLIGMVGLFVAYLLVRHGERKAAVVEL
ncbi:unnamed protein product [Discula destructiva]